jgi:hypothetical protein
MAVHQIGWNAPLFMQTEWEGRTGWRKPLVFGISNAMIFASLRVALHAQQPVARRLISHVAAWSTVIEVAIITLQAWRDVPSHFNTDTEFDALMYAVKLVGALVLSGACVWITCGLWSSSRLQASACQKLALRHGLLLICLAAGIGALQVVYGHMPRKAHPSEHEFCRFVTAGATGSPCYEIHGQAIVKLAHFLPLHATEVLLLLAWAIDQTGHLKAKLIGLMHVCIVACWSLAIIGICATIWGWNLKAPPSPTVVVLIPVLGSIPTVFILTFFAAYGQVSKECND